MKEERKKQAGAARNKTASALAILAAILVMTNLWTFFVYAPGKISGSIGNEKDKYDFLDPARKLYSRKNLIINIQPLRDELNAIGEKDKNISIYFEYLPTGANISVNKDAEFWPASMLKVPIAMSAVKKIESGKWKWTNELVVMAPDKSSGFGDLYKMPIGTRLTIEELVKKSLVDSDNTANFMLARNLEPEELQDIYDHLGLSDFISEEGKIGAKKYSVILRALYSASYLSEENSQKILSLLKETSFKEYLASGLPDGVDFAHKIGVHNEKGVALDSGIVYLPNRPYLLTAMINVSDEQYAEQIMGKISETVYNYIVNYRE